MQKILLTVCAFACAVPALALRPPAVPLVTVDPFFSVWSAADRLTDVETTHWTGARQPVTVLLEADGRTWRLCGATPADVPALPQLTTEVRPTQTVCTFAEGALRVELRFSTAKLPDDLDVFSRPVTYVTARVQGARTWRLKPSISAALATNDDAAPTVTNRTEVAGLPAVSIGRRDQTPLGRCGDRLRCDWGWAWLVGPSAPVAGESHFLLAYDDVKSIRFFGQDLPAWWRRGGLAFTDMLAAALRDRADLLVKLDRFDAELARDLARVGGEKYAALACLSYRQSFAACKLVADPNGQPFYFSKENGSGGLIGTTDVFYPQLPHLLLTSPALAKATLAPTCIYAASGKWPYPYAPHDLGVYPVAEGQYYGMKKVRQHAHRARGGGDGRGECGVRGALVGRGDEVGGVPLEVRLRPRQPALHGRLRGASRAQRKPVRQVHRGPRVLRAARGDARRAPRSSCSGPATIRPTPGRRSTTSCGTASSDSGSFPRPSPKAS